MKKLFGMVFIIMLCSTMITAAADGSAILTVNGIAVSAGFEPVWNEQHNRLLIKATFFTEYFGADVDSTGDVTEVSKNGHTIAFKIGEKQFVMDGIGGRALDDENIAVDGEAYLPLRFMCEALGSGVEWNGEANTVNIIPDGIRLPDAAAPYMRGLTVFDQSTIRITGEKTIYIDPYRIAGQPQDADIILVTHSHNDHFNIESIARVINDDTVVLVTEDAVEKAKENGFANVVGVSPNSEYTVEGIQIKTIPAYNISKQNHKKESGFVGYIVSVNGYTYYAAGDTDYIPEMDDLDVDVAFLPIDGRFNMEETEAARGANAINPKVAVPYHYNSFSTEQAATTFVSLLNPDITGAIMTFKMYVK